MNPADRDASPLRAALAACRRHLGAAAGFSAGLNLLYLAPTLYMLQVYDRVVPTRGAVTLVLLTLILAFTLATLSLLDWVRTRLLTRASLRLDRVLAPAILERQLAGEPSSRQAMRDFDLLRQTLTGPAMLALFDAPWTPIYIVVCLLIHPALGALAILGAGAIVGLAWLTERATRERLRRAAEAASAAYVSQDQSVAAADIVRALGMRGAMVRRHMAERAVSSRLQAEAGLSSGGFVASARFVRMLLQSLALGLGALLAIEQQVSAGAIFAASLLVSRALAPMDQLLGAWRGLVQARNAYADLETLLAKGARATPQTRLPEPAGGLKVEGLGVLSPARDRPLIRGVDLAVAPGEALGVIGPSGAGKTTLLRAIAGAAAPDQGAVRFDGADAAEWDPERLARHIGYAPQEPALFAGTVKENIARFGAFEGDAEATDVAAVAAARLCGAHEMIQRLPDGYDTRLGFGGRGLSAGQAQRVVLARALFGEPRYVFLDEPNAHLDAEAETLLAETVQRLKARGAVVMIAAQRTGILGVIDRLLVLREGMVELLGPRDDVLKRLAAPRPGAPRIGAA